MFTKRVFNIGFVLFLAIILIMGGCTAPSPTSTTYTITVTAGTGGQIDPEGEVVISEEGSQTFTITTDRCYTVDDVLVDGVSVGPVTTYTFGDIQEDHTIHATFVSGPKAYNADTGVDYTFIQEAIDAALVGETIIVCPGTYYENLIFDGRNITVQSTDPLDSAIVAATIIDGGGSGHVVEFFGDDTSTLKGFTIRNGNTSYGGGIYVADSYSTITGNIITDNMAEHYGGGIYVSSSTLTITGNTITDNFNSGHTIDGGGGISVSYSDYTITGNTITGNEADYGGGISIYYSYSTSTITGNTINDNYASSGGGISLNNSSPTIEDNTITGNTAEYRGGGIYVSSCDDPNITGNTINDNNATIGGGISLLNSSSTIEDNTITNNMADSYGGGGIHVSSSSDLLPVNHRPNGWGTGREHIPTGATLDPAEGVTYTIAGNEFLGNQQGDPLDYTEGAHVYFY
ncbi:MAG: right-handed parallel beta-helix repeat-containing protein [Atribacterota bacterium]|nr:right-handed parallel beta-helix repeat-containing protein [Atribacterota bacterium]